MSGDLHTTAQAARELGVSPQLVRRLAARYNLGTLVTPRLRLLSDADLDVMRRRETRPGRPVRPA